MLVMGADQLKKGSPSAVEYLRMKMMRIELGCFPLEISGHIQQERDPAVDPKLAGGILFSQSRQGYNQKVFEEFVKVFCEN